jgi:hypothetical protein
MHQIIAPNKLRWDVFLQVKAFETDIVRQQVLRRSLMQSNIETFQSVGVRVVFCCFEEPYSMWKDRGSQFICSN